MRNSSKLSPRLFRQSLFIPVPPVTGFFLFFSRDSSLKMADKKPAKRRLVYSTDLSGGSTVGPSSSSSAGSSRISSSENLSGKKKSKIHDPPPTSATAGSSRIPSSEKSSGKKKLKIHDPPPTSATAGSSRIPSSEKSSGKKTSKIHDPSPTSAIAGPSGISSSERSTGKKKTETKKKIYTAQEVAEMLQNSDWDEEWDSSDISISSEDEDEDDDVQGRIIFVPQSYTQPPCPQTASPMAYSRPSSPLQNSPLAGSNPASPSQNSPASDDYTPPDIPADSWVSTPTARRHFPFSGPSGIKVAPDGNDPIDYFFHLFDDDLFNLIIKESNDQAWILASLPLKPSARISHWKDITRDEFEIFLGLIFLTGQIHAPTIRHYWQVNKLYNFPVFREAMGRDRFILILRALHFAKNPDPGEPKPLDPLFKVTPLFDHFHGRMKQIYYPNKELSLDESMLLWRGRLYFRQYIQNKRHKFGLKFYMLTQPDGLVLKSRIYCGSSDPVLGGQNHVEKVVKDLTQDYLGVGHSIYMDNFYSSVSIAKFLSENKTYTTGTLRGNRKGNPVEIIKSKLKKGEVKSAYDNSGICILKWRDKREVLILSSEFGDTKLPTKSKSGKELEKPEAVLKYNQFMGGVGRSDQLLSYYPCERKTMRWYVKVAFHIFHVIMNNAYLLHKKHATEGLRLLEFRDSVIMALLYRNRPNTQISPAITSKQKIHSLMQVPRNEKNRFMKKRCSYCKKKGKRIESNFFCDECDEKPGLCIDCFKPYHNYK